MKRKKVLVLVVGGIVDLVPVIIEWPGFRE